jgi:hypothetical protein
MDHCSLPPPGTLARCRALLDIFSGQVHRVLLHSRRRCAGRHGALRPLLRNKGRGTNEMLQFTASTRCFLIAGGPTRGP